MTIELLAVFGLDDDEQAILSELCAEAQAKAAQNLLRASYCDGKRAILQGQSLHKSRGDSDSTFIPLGR